MDADAGPPMETRSPSVWPEPSPVSTGFLSDTGLSSGRHPSPGPVPSLREATGRPRRCRPGPLGKIVQPHLYLASPLLHLGESTASRNMETHVSETNSKSKAKESDFFFSLTLRSRGEVSVLEPITEPSDRSSSDASRTRGSGQRTEDRQTPLRQRLDFQAPQNPASYLPDLSPLRISADHRY